MSAWEPLRGSDDLIREARGYFRGRVLAAAVRLGLPEHLDDPRTLADLAERTGTDPASVERLLRALAALGLVEDSGDGYRNTATGRQLRREDPSHAWASVLLWSDLLADNWSFLDECVRTGDTAWAVTERAGPREGLRFSQEPEAGAIFHGAMAAGADAEAHRPIVAAYPFAESRVIADLGGGAGGLLAAILQEHPEAQGVLVDSEQALEGARATLEEAGVSSRSRVIAHDLNEGVPVAADIYILKHVLHACNDDEAAAILASCRRDMPSGSRLLVVEVSLAARVEAPSRRAELAAMLDLTMMVMTGGRERNAAAWAELLARSSFDTVRTFEADMVHQPLTIIEAVPRR